jgi:hypothetical protein
MAANAATRVAGKELLKKGIEKGATALHWAISIAPNWYYASRILSAPERLQNQSKQMMEEKKQIYELMYGQEADILFDKTLHEHKSFLQQELQSLGYQNLDTIDFVPFSAFATIANFNTQKLSYDFDTIEDISKNTLENSHNFGYLKAVLSHEMGHLAYQHTKKEFFLNLILPFATYSVQKNILSSFKTPQSFSMRNGLKIALGMANLGTNMLAIWAFRCLAERDADEAVVNDPKVLKGMAEVLNYNAKLRDEFERTLDTKNLLMFKLQWLCKPHPHILTRAQRFEERAAQMHAAEQKV